MRLRPRDIWVRIAFVLATGFGIGLVPWMPGTFGSLLGLPLAWLVDGLSWPVPFKAALEGAVILAGIPICGQAARSIGRSDPGSVVYDEFAALPLLFLSLPFRFSTAILGFLWFRLFDILKPWPVRLLERLPGGLGIVADDVAAAVFAAIALWLTVRGWETLAVH